ncbi:MAG TPA: GNAT family N-acetyltransferase [Gaiellaceae bacterium]|nr:GNAT family N-acetyltransferase [Gaiellaceae bacterium]
MAAQSVTIAPASPGEIGAVRPLLEEYARSLAVDLRFQRFDDELAGLPGAYAPPRGALLVARAGGLIVGCVGVRPLDARTCEMKRLYVQSSRRGSGLGRRLAEAAIAEGRRLGYAAMRLDTLPGMEAAQALYEVLGFRDVAAYTDNPVPGARFLELVLS